MFLGEGNLDETSKKTSGAKSLYNWGYRFGVVLLCNASNKYDEDTAEHLLLRVLKELRNERFPDRFKFKLTMLLTDILTDIGGDVSFPSDFKSGEDMKLDKFYRASSLILMGLWDSLVRFRSNKNDLCGEVIGNA